MTTGPRHFFSAAIAGGAFFVAGMLAVLLTRFDNGFAFIWPASAVLVAYLISTQPRHWMPGLVACGAASLCVTGFFGLGWPAALPMLVANLTEALAAALLMRRAERWRDPDNAVQWLLQFMATTAGVGCIASALVAGSALWLLAGSPFIASFGNWYTGHALGMLTFVPIFTFAASGELARRFKQASARQLQELLALTTAVGAVSVLAFAQSAMPLLFLPFLPIILTTFRAGRLGAALSIVTLALIGAAFTVRGYGPIALMNDSIAVHVRVLQLYLAAAVLTILPIAADLSRRARLTRRLRESEARYRMLADNSTDIIMNVDVNGRIQFVSPAIRHLGGYDEQALRGRMSTELIAPDHVETVRAAHIEALRARGAAVRVEYLGLLQSGETRWFETRMRAVLDDLGYVEGAVSVIRDISERKVLEQSLTQAAIQDPLTGVLNRRGFMAELERVAATDRKGCLALFDIDHFKRVNDSFGHAAGDEVLKHFARIASGMLRSTDHMGRIGGEEFAVLLRGAGVDEATAVCERLRAAVAARPCLYEGERIALTVSGGVTLLDGASMAELFRRVDAALYRAKAGGRDQLKIAA